MFKKLTGSMARSVLSMLLVAVVFVVAGSVATTRTVTLPMTVTLLIAGLLGMFVCRHQDQVEIDDSKEAPAKC